MFLNYIRIFVIYKLEVLLGIAESSSICENTSMEVFCNLTGFSLCIFSEA